MPGLGDELHADLVLAFQQGRRNREHLVFELGNAVLACVIDTCEQGVVDEDVELVRFPLAHAPELETEAEVRASARLHQVTEGTAVAGVAEKDVVRVARDGSVGFHLVVGLGLLLAGLHLVDGARFQRHPLLLRTGEVLQTGLVSLLGKGQPVHHIPGVVDLEEGL